MKAWQWLIVAALVLWLFWEGDGNIVDGARAVVGDFTRGARVTRAPYSKVDGVVRVDPSELARQAGVDLDTYALARMVSSEEGNSSDEIRTAVCWAVKNYARRAGKAIAPLLLRANNPNHTGWFGTQRDIDRESANYNKSDRYASTANDPHEGDIALASVVINEYIPDPTGGADQFDRPAGLSDPGRVAQNRINAGKVPADVEGVNADEIRFWRPATA